MSRRTYTHFQELLPEIEAMVKDGNTQREIAERFWLKGKNIVKRPLARARAKPLKPEAGISHDRKGGQEKLVPPKILL